MIEAGLGGRYDATNVLGAEVVVLTNVGLEHTRWLGPTIADIAGEKLAVVREARRSCSATTRPRCSRWPRPRAPRSCGRRRRGLASLRRGRRELPGYQRRNFAAAVAAAEALLGPPLDAEPFAAAAPLASPGACRSSTTTR